MSLLNDGIMNALEKIIPQNVPAFAGGAYYESGCGCSGDCGQSCSGDCLAGCTGDCGRSCYGDCN